MASCARSSLLPPSLTVSLGGSAVRVSRLTTRQTLRLLPPLFSIIDLITETAVPLSVRDLMTVRPAEVTQIAEEATGLTAKQLGKLKPAEFGAAVDACITTNKDFLHRQIFVAPEPDDRAGIRQEAEPFTADSAAQFIEKLVYDLRVGTAIGRDELLENTLADNLGLLDALYRSEAKTQLTQINALTSALPALFSEEAGQALAAHSEKLSRAAGFKSKDGYTGEPLTKL